MLDMQGMQQGETSGADVVRRGRAAGLKGWSGRREDDGGGEAWGVGVGGVLRLCQRMEHYWAVVSKNSPVYIHCIYAYIYIYVHTHTHTHTHTRTRTHTGRHIPCANARCESSGK